MVHRSLDPFVGLARLLGMRGHERLSRVGWLIGSYLRGRGLWVLFLELARLRRRCWSRDPVLRNVVNDEELH